ncbi:MAG: hypothetical protein ABMA64_31795, partial [Myxococcota bacterium]
PRPARPVAAPGLLDAVRAAVPTRIHKRLEGGNPADGWVWTAGSDGWTVAAGDDTVTVSTAGAVGPEHLGCTCLLSPKCLHVLAVATAIADAGPATEAAPAPVVVEAPIALEPVVPLDRGQRGAAAAMVRAATAVLLAGATGVGATAQQDLVRAVHSAKAVGLHRLAKAGTRVNRQVKDLQRARAQFALDDLVDDLRELLLVARVLSGDRPTAGYVGTARRTYDPVGTLRLYGLCTEAVLSTTGVGGVVTVSCDATGRVWTVPDVRPDWGPAKYDASPGIGGLTLSHRALGRSGLFAQDATASVDGRIGTGGGVKAVRSGPSSWDDPGPASLFAAPLSRQLDRAFAGGAGEPWLFVSGQVIGAHDDALLLAAPDLGFPLRLVTASDHPDLRYRDNLRLLARAPGLPLRVIGRLAPGPRGTVAPIAIGPWNLTDADPELPKLALPKEWVERCNLGLDLLVASHVERIGAALTEVQPLEVERPDPLEAMRRRVARLALGGRGTLPGDARSAVEREMGALRRELLPTAAATLGQLADAAAAARTEGGDRLVSAWLAAAVFDEAARRSLHRASWR